MVTHLDPSSPAGATLGVRLRMPAVQAVLDQDEEWCEVEVDGRWRHVRFHDYHEIYRVPGLYEAVFARRLKCCSPQRVVGLLDDVLSDFPQNAEDLRVIDVGAGNGMVGQELRDIGVEQIIGVDIIPEARSAALRDRPGVYQDYLVADLTCLRPEQALRLRASNPNCLSTVAALGYGDIPALAFVNACNLIAPNGWLVFNIKESFLHPEDDQSGFAGLIHCLQREKMIQIQAYRRYCHRLSIRGRPLHYVAIIANKLEQIPVELAESQE